MQQPENLLLVFFGMIATGKSYLASAWAQQFELPYYNSDRVRKELAGISAETDQQEEVDKGIYSPEFSRRTYETLIEKAKAHFAENNAVCVVLDGSYQSMAERDLLRKQFDKQVCIIFDPEKCTGCSLCVPICPVRAMEVSPVSSAFTEEPEKVVV